MKTTVNFIINNSSYNVEFKIVSTIIVRTMEKFRCPANKYNSFTPPNIRPTLVTLNKKYLAPASGVFANTGKLIKIKPYNPKLIATTI